VIGQALKKPYWTPWTTNKIQQIRENYKFIVMGESVYALRAVTPTWKKSWAGSGHLLEVKHSNIDASDLLSRHDPPDPPLSTFE
jgi:hypothetical protein